MPIVILVVYQEKFSLAIFKLNYRIDVVFTINLGMRYCRVNMIV